jgi:hypothetical protein
MGLDNSGLVDFASQQIVTVLRGLFHEQLEEEVLSV